MAKVPAAHGRQAVEAVALAKAPGAHGEQDRMAWC